MMVAAISYLANVLTEERPGFHLSLQRFISAASMRLSLLE